MEKIETRLLEEWKATNDLLKFYKDLKQKRFAHFLTIRTAFLAFFGIAAEASARRACARTLAWARRPRST